MQAHGQTVIEGALHMLLLFVLLGGARVLNHTGLIGGSQSLDQD